MQKESRNDKAEIKLFAIYEELKTLCLDNNHSWVINLFEGKSLWRNFY